MGDSIRNAFKLEIKARRFDKEMKAFSKGSKSRGSAATSVLRGRIRRMWRPEVLR